MTGATLEAVLDALLPGGEGFPAAGAVGLADWIRAEARFAAPVEAVVSRLTRGADLPAALAALEKSDPDGFGLLITAAYSGYYSNPAVLEVVETRTGYKSGPPQPGGYDLPEFDADILSVPKTHAPSYRDPDRKVPT